MHNITSLLLVLLPLLPAQTVTRGPSVWEHSASSFLVAFKTSSAATGQIEWGPTEALGNTTSGPSTTNHAIRITGLLPDHFYWYRVRLNSVVATPVYRTRTFASTGSDVSFFVFGDSGVGNANQLRVAGLYESYDWDLGLLAGDVVYPDGAPQDFDPNFFGPYAAALRSTPHFPVVGNHDAHTQNAQPYLDAFYLPTGNSGTERWYSFDFGKCHFIGLDSNQANSPSQRTWLRNDIIAARASNAEWIFVTLHHPPYSSGDVHGRNQTVYNNWCPIFEEFEVDAVFTGHDHIYERSTIIRDFYPNNRGVVYFVVGTGGAVRYSVTPEPYSAVALSKWGVLKVDVRGSVFRSVFLDGDAGTLGQQLDPYSIVRAPVTLSLRETGPSPQVGQSFVGTFHAPNGTPYVLFAALQPGYANVPGLGLVHVGGPIVSLASGVMGSTQSAPFSLAVPSQPALVGTGLFFQGLTVNGTLMTLHVTDLLHGRVR